MPRIADGALHNSKPTARNTGDANANAADEDDSPSRHGGVPPRRVPVPSVRQPSLSRLSPAAKNDSIEGHNPYRRDFSDGQIGFRISSLGC